MEVGPFRLVTQHFMRVRRMMELFGQKTPNKPTPPDPETRILRARLIMEEALELIQEGLGVVIYDLDGWSVQFEELEFSISKLREPNMELIADGCADVSVVTIGTLVACGLPDDYLLQIVDNNNLEKVAKGHRDEYGKFIKHPDHQPPDISGYLDVVKDGYVNEKAE